jgi:hypothetical protein
MWYTSGSQPLCRGTVVCRKSPPSVLQDCKIQSNLSTTATLGTPKKWPLCRVVQSLEVFQLKLVLKLVWPDFAWPLLTGGRYSEVAVNTGLTVMSFLSYFTYNTQC